MKRRALPYALLVYAVGLAALLWISSQTGPALGELGVLGAIERSEELVKRIASRGLGELLVPEQRAALDSGVLVLVGAWSKLSLGRMGVVDPLTAARLPWLVLGALAPLSLYLMLAPSRGRAVALGGALLVLAMPRFSHAVVVQGEGALVASLSSLVLALHVRAMGPGRPGAPGARATLAWALFAALCLGFSLAQSFGVLWVLPLAVIHFAWARRSLLRRGLPRGRFPLPTWVLVAIPVAPVVLLALKPSLWRSSPALIARFILAPLEPSVVQTELAGKLVDRLPVPGTFAASHLFHTLPLSVGLLGLFGFGVVLHEQLARRFASGSLRPPRDRHALGALAMLGVFFALVGPALTPDVLTTFPPRVEVIVPFVALGGAIGLGRLGHFAGSPGLGRAFGCVTLGALLAVVLTQAGTASASAGPLFGGARRVAATRALPLGDGSEVAVLGRAIDALGRPSVTLSAPPELSPELWRWLGEGRRMRTRVTVQPDGELVLARGAPGTAARLADVRRDGAVLWTLTRAAQ